MAVLQRSVSNVSSTNPQPVVGSVFVTSQTTNNNFYSSKLLNYVESVEVDGVLKTAFFSEVNTNFNIGDRVFIVNGNYDSNELVNVNKYRKFCDGYRILSVNGCRVILDIDYTGASPYSQYTTRDFIFIHVVDTQKDFDYINTVKVSLDGSPQTKSIFSGNIVDGKLVLECQNILYVTRNFQGGQSPTDVYGKVDNSGFWVRVDDGVNNLWIDVSYYVISNNIVQNNLFSTSGNIFIRGKDFVYDDVYFESNSAYKYENYEWIIDVKSYTPYISKLNFRSGKFVGVHNDGIFGSNDKKINWDNATWNSGVFINSNWLRGYMNSKHTPEELSYLCTIEEIGGVRTIVQSLDNTNNRGFGYNFIENSNFHTYSIGNGNFYNCVFGTESQYKSALDIYYSLDTQFSNVANAGKYEFCEINDMRGNNSTFLNSLVRNSNLLRSKLNSSEVINSTLDRGYWSTDAGVKIIGADLWSYDYNQNTIFNATQSNILGTIKLYISENDYFKLSSGDTFYISNLNKDVISNLLDDDNKILHLLENRYLIDNYDDYDLQSNNLTKIKVSLKSSKENTYKTYVKTSNATVNYYDYVIDDEDTSSWYEIPTFLDQDQPQLRFGGWDLDYSTSTGYIFGDYVYTYDFFGLYNNGIPDLDTYLFFIYCPVNKGDVNDGRIGERAEDDQQAVLYGASWKEYGPNDYPLTPSGLFLNDWILVGSYSANITSATGGLWDKFATYSGVFYPGTQNPYFPTLPLGQVVRDNDQDSNYYIFVGGNGNKTKQILVGFDYVSQNSITQSNYNFPSIDITSNIFGWYENVDGRAIPTSNNIISPINHNNINNIFLNTVIGNGDFKSGLVDSSTWLSGDHTNDYSNIIMKLGSNLDILIDTYFSRKILTIKLVNKKLSSDVTYNYDGYGHSVGDYVWIKSLRYVSGGTVSNLEGRYKVVKYLSNSDEVSLVSVDAVDPIENLQSGGIFYIDSGSTNNYFSLHKSNFYNNTVESGKFKRSGLQNCRFRNDIFKKYVYPSADVKNIQLTRLVNIMFQNTGNIVESGTVYKSHFVNDVMNGGTFFNSIWLGGTFSDGLFKNSVWSGGNFNGGKFVDSRESTIFTFDYDTTSNNKLWQGGNFNGGEFYNSLWVRGNFNGGRFYFSDWTGGTWSNGVLGSKDFRIRDTTMAYYGPTTSFGATHTVWYNGLVENALVGGFGSIDWYGGKMIGGEFTSEGRSQSNYSIWHDGDFYNSSFTKLAWWHDGNFYSGKFLSEIGWNEVNLLTHSNSTFSYGWLSGNFYGGEFGNGSTLTNSVWYDGIMEGGVFQGRFWRDGLVTNGKFYGSLITQSDINQSLLAFSQSFYGLWNDGYVDNIIYNVKTDRIVTTEPTDVISKKTKQVLKMVDMNNIVWVKGTFSHELSTFNNSVWLSGEFNAGNFNNSYFNPFIDLTLSGASLDDFQRMIYTKSLFDSVEIILNDPNNSGLPLSSYLSQINQKLNEFNDNSSINSNFIIEYSYFSGQYAPLPPDYNTFSYDETNLNNFPVNDFDTTVFARIYDKELIKRIPTDYIGMSFYNNATGNDPLFDYYYVYKNMATYNIVPYSFNTSDECIWRGGNFNGGEFNYSKWTGGNFNDGTMNGAIWLDGVFNYGFMNNSYWENGMWRNGNWDGSPYDHSKLTFQNTFWEVSDPKTDQILKNISNYTGNNQLHLSNVIVQDTSNISQIHTFDATDFTRWQVDPENLIQ
jgi:hypothetical protein